MKNRKRVTLVAAIGLALLAQLMQPARAYADGETTPPPIESPTPEPTHPAPTKPGVDMIPTELQPTDPVETSTPTPSTDSPEPTKEPADSTPDPVQTTSPEPTGEVEKPNLLDVLQEFPGDTSVIVLDESGQPLTLASQATADIVAQADPMWCPEGVAPGGAGCTSAYATLTDLLSNAGTYINSQNMNGVIWITSGNIDDTNPIVIDGSTFTNWANYSLSLQGGWSGINGDITIGSNSVFFVPITLANWNNGITIQNIDAPSITLSNVTSNATGNGIDVSNTTADVQLNNIDIDGASGTGIYVDTSGAIHANNISSKNNTRINNGPCPVECGNGAFLIGANGVTLAGTNVFTGNAWTGLDAWSSNGDITLENVTASNNLGFGGAFGYGNVTITGTSFFNNNGVFGAWISGNNVTLNGTSQFLDNNNVGLELGAGGNITLNSVTAIGNAGGININTYGEVVIDNVTVDQSSGFGLGIVTGGGNVTINNSRFTNTIADFSNPTYPWGDGVDIFSNGGNITIAQSQFTGNAYDGLFVVDSSDITINQSQFTGNFINGLNVFNAGNITIVDSGFDNHGGTGMSISNAGNLTLSGGVFSNNYVGLSVSCVESVSFNLPLTTFSGNALDIVTDPSCPINIIPPQPLTFLQTQGELFKLDCATGLNRYVVRLANGDRGEIFCPVDGEASIDRVDNTTLPASLPTGYTYASAFDVKILQNDQRISVITEGGYITASFMAQHSQSGNIYTILYWDAENSTWIPLKDFLLNEQGKPESFDLYPGVEGDARKILSGVNLVTKNGEARVEVSTNFPGIFALAQH